VTEFSISKGCLQLILVTKQPTCFGLPKPVYQNFYNHAPNAKLPIPQLVFRMKNLQDTGVDNVFDWPKVPNIERETPKDGEVKPATMQ
jgi:hypothetical protein